MGLYFFVFIVLCLVTAMVIRVRDLEEEREEQAPPLQSTAGRRENERT